MPRADRFLDIRRAPHSGEVLARGGDPEAHSVLQRCGFVPVVRVHEIYHRAPVGLDEAEETRLAIDAVARLRVAGYHVDCDEPFDTNQRTLHYLPLGAQVAQLADRIRKAAATEDAAEVLTELTATHDGILAGIEAVLTATADFHDSLGDPADPHIARRLRYLADERLRVIRTDLAHTRDALADRHAPSPGRNTCTEEVPATEREASALCAGPPPPRTVPAPPPTVAGRRR
ncbi:hypothetical protein [Streptomyces chromofuscus]|uniref:Uncharacterized protein n=1 Tax=Streptomyces chromofuscus TaxID=42881 RepID=A0A7M2T3Y2_STRCW|nr:hypothetical protein [Streptomyces chromofuscus]QOV42994.1 hypothetical protein IPT68_24870 [Streptomyces chromofuscus]GGS92821.1 hypothetical protein GCM10010254_10930 [Streptomyces chromofuscus]